MSDLADRVLAELPPRVAALFGPFAERQLIPTTELRTRLEEHSRSLKASAVEFFDHDLLNRLNALATCLLAHIESDPRGYSASIAHAAILYFLLDEDAAPDSTELLGLDDDLLVLEATCRALGIET